MRGMRNIQFNEAKIFRKLTNKFADIANDFGYREFIPSSVAEQSVFIDKAGREILSQMYTFDDKGGRKLCLIPEVTAIVQKEYKEYWDKTMPKPVMVFYLTRCYRYERPQLGRYREFWQFGVESLGNTLNKDDMIKQLYTFLQASGLKDFKVNDSVKRGLSYYTEDGFEVESPILGAQKQIAGGGRYDCGIGWSIGVDRLLLALSLQNK